MKLARAIALLTACCCMLAAGGCSIGKKMQMPQTAASFSCTVEVEREDAFLSGMLHKDEEGYFFLIQYPEPLCHMGFLLSAEGDTVEVSCQDIAQTVPIGGISETSIIRDLFGMLSAVRAGEPAELVAQNGNLQTFRWEDGEQAYFAKINEETGMLQELADEQLRLKLTFLDYE